MSVSGRFAEPILAEFISGRARRANILGDGLGGYKSLIDGSSHDDRESALNAANAALCAIGGPWSPSATRQLTLM